MPNVVASFTVVVFFVTAAGAFATSLPSPNEATSESNAYRRCQAWLGQQLPNFRAGFQDLSLLPVDLANVSAATILLRWYADRTLAHEQLRLGLAADLNVRAARYVIPLTQYPRGEAYYTILAGSAEELEREAATLIDVHGDRAINYQVITHQGRIEPAGRLRAPSLVFTPAALARGLTETDRAVVAKEGLTIYTPGSADMYFLFPNEAVDRLSPLLIAKLRVKILDADRDFDLEAHLDNPPTGKYIIRTPDFALVSGGTLYSINRYADRRHAQGRAQLDPQFANALDVAVKDAYANVPILEPLITDGMIAASATRARAGSSNVSPDRPQRP